MTECEAIDNLKNLFSNYELTLPNTDSLETLQFTIKALEEVREYKRLEEQGLLIKLQYPLGTELYFPFKCQGVIKDRIRRWQLNKNGLFFCSYAGNAYRLEAIGKNIFLTREEAALEGMNENA